MELFGLTLGQVLFVLGGASALTVALHMLRAHHKRAPVPFLPLWESVLARREGSRLFARLTRVLSLLLSLLIMLLLALALGDPRPAAGAAGMTHRVVLIDAGLAMQARDIAGEPRARLGAALGWARKLTAQAGPLLPTLLVQVDSAAVPLGPFTHDTATLDRALNDVAPSDLSTDVAGAYRFALDALEGRKRGEIIFIGSGAFDPPAGIASEAKRRNIELQRIAIGVRDDNVAITGMAARRYPLDRNRSELLIGLRNAGKRAAKAELTVLGDGAVLDVRSFELAPGVTEQRIYDDIAFSGTKLQARLRTLEPSRDVLAADSVGYAVLPARKRMRVLCVTTGNRYLEAALLLDEYFGIEIAAPNAVPPLAGYDAVIFDRVAPTVPVSIPALYLAADAVPGFAALGTIERPRFDELRSDSAILRHANLRDVNIAQAIKVQPSPGDKVLARSVHGPLILSGERAGVPFVALTFEVQQSDLPLRVAWPLLLINTLDWFADERRELTPSYVLGETVRVALPPSEATERASVRVKPPAGPSFAAPLAEGDALLAPTQAGFYELRSRSQTRIVAVGFDPSAPLDLSPGKTSADLRVLERRPLPDIWALLIACALGLIAFEWLAFHRRWAP